jgi:hypothetical protein
MARICAQKEQSYRELQGRDMSKESDKAKKKKN